ncbi:MAG: hypothetical protein A3G25_06325 [Betaproteobacteria bacterium RIFCSPLOWO2_12_FULL_63_13]|nr:MAG: hypothetical protein A3H32_18570 [Betaproteobacteria bacterium RIFCSPLOWO2_02_FULL_63_19]OGA49653.1 MAG: hypothetical protein A3G25_06325 [Betaproteobacteria bacterium RIFCSPLOWO2_12_FULL_63_13]
MSIVSYLVLCLMVAILGRRTRLGFYRSLLFSIMVTPIVIMLYLLLFATVDAETRAEEGTKKDGA